jgi:alginate O-acetyltransferase complex protein AlgI
MVFSSVIFLFAFLPAFLAVYFVIPQRFIGVKNVVLLLFSLLFYAWGEPVYVCLMVASIFLNWLLALFIQRANQKNFTESGGLSGKILLAVAICINLAILGFFKYQGFIAHNLNRILGEAYITDLQLALPIGISFFTLQALTYVIDVYRGQAHAQKKYSLFGHVYSDVPAVSGRANCSLFADRGAN